MKIGVDIDDVITNTGEMLVAYSQYAVISWHIVKKII